MILNNLINENGVLKTLFNSTQQNNKISVFGCGKGEKFTILNEIDKFTLFVCEDEKSAFDNKDSFENMNYRCDVLCQPDFFNNDFNDNKHILKVLNNLVNNNLDVLIVTPAMLFKILPSVNYVKDYQLKLCQNQMIDVDEVNNQLIKFGYTRTDHIEHPYEFMVRGDIIELFLGDDKYYRLMFSYGELEKIKKCNPITLLPICDEEDLVVFGLNLLDIDQAKLETFLDKSKRMFASILKENLEHKENLLYFLMFAKNMTGKIFDFMPDDALIAINDCKNVYDNLNAFVTDFNADLKRHIKERKLHEEYEKYLLNNQVIFPEDYPIIAFQYITNANNLFKPNKVFSIASSPSVSYVKNKNLLVQNAKTCKKTSTSMIIFAGSEENAVQLTKLFDSNRIEYNLTSSVTKIVGNQINIVSKSFAFSSRFSEEQIFIVGTQDIFPIIKKIKDEFVESYSNTFLPEINDFVVHEHYGIAKYLGVKCLDLKGGKRDYFVLEYKNNDILYLPVENLNSIAKFVGTDKTPKLSKLGSNDFINTKNTIKTKIKQSAIDLLKLYSQRQAIKGYKYPADDELYEKFEQEFGYDLTPDQALAINDIKSDMEQGKLMDRLVCGDVGFGKTEVALRAAFKTILAGKQVAFLCPTTILSQQHYNTALMRFKNFGINVEVLNRFKTYEEADEIYESVSLGETDMLVGTQRLLNKKVNFKNLGLLILDEEQKFGVEDKEYIKTLKENVNVLALSATPIPRTLHMSMVGIRDISVIETPPEQRLSTQVSVIEYDDVLIREAIKQELERKGQVLITYNNIENIYSFASHIKKLIGDEPVVDVAHGQMPERELSFAISRLYNKQTDVFISTTLIENGVDLPNANTLIVINADMLGLAQLYQLKGRIGRSNKQAFAYFTYDGSKILNETSYKRLEAISQYTAMGSGFKIALKDLEIRGGGNVLGVEQSGHMEKVGYSLYLQLLNEAISEIKGEEVKRISDVKVECSIPAYISNNFESNYNARISLYLKISKIESKENLQNVLKELSEAYSYLPKEIVNLCNISYIRHLASHILAQKVVINEKNASIHFESINDFNANIVDALSKFSNFAVSNMQKEPIIYINSNNDNSIFELLIDFLSYCIK